MRTIKISVTRTVQVERFEPATVTVEESIQIDDKKDPEKARKQLYKDVTQQVKSYIDNEIRKYTNGKGKKREDD